MTLSTLRVLLAGLLLSSFIAACAGAGDADATVAHYERVWPDGFTEVTTVFDDGRVSMLHGEHLERFTLSERDLSRVVAALALPIEVGDPSDSPQRTLTLADGSVIEAPRPDPDSVVDLLDRLTSSHTLDPQPAVDGPVVPSPSSPST